MDLTSILKIRDFFNFKDWLDDRKFGKRDDLRNLAKRIVKVLDVHEIPASRIPFVFQEHNFKPKDFSSLDSIVQIIDEPLLSSLTDKFHLNRSWLDDGYGPPQKVYEHGYDFGRIYDLLIDLSNKENQWSTMYFIAEEGTKFVPAEDHGAYQGIIIALATTIDSESDKFSYKEYHPIYEGYWHYYKSRMMIKAISLLCFQLRIHQKGYFSKNANYGSMDKYFVPEILSACTPKSWHPDDYIFTSNKSHCSKDREDAQRLHDYLREINCFDRIKNLSPCQWLE